MIQPIDLLHELKVSHFTVNEHSQRGATEVLSTSYQVYKKFIFINNGCIYRQLIILFIFTSFNHCDGGLLGPDGVCISEVELWESEQISDALLKPCMSRILTDLKNLTTGVGQIVQKFAGNTPGYNWELKDGPLSGGTASTSPVYNHSTGTVTTTFDSQAWKQATELSWARTLLHESIHAYLVAWDKQNSLSTKLTTYPQLMQDYFNGINANTAQHQEIARNFIQDLADALEEYGTNKGYNHSRQFYEDMSWAGLQGTSYFLNLPLSDRNRILDINSIELTGMDLQGNTKIQKGKNAGC